MVHCPMAGDTITACLPLHFVNILAGLVHNCAQINHDFHPSPPPTKSNFAKTVTMKSLSRNTPIRIQVVENS